MTADAYSRELYDNPNAAVAVAAHPENELLAQSICTSIAGFRGWTYAVQRVCTGQSTYTCTQICTSQNLRKQDPETSERQWFAAAAIHVYSHRPSSSPGTPSSPHIGLKVFHYGNVDTVGCGPNWCCCHVAANDA